MYPYMSSNNWYYLANNQYYPIEMPEEAKSLEAFKENYIIPVVNNTVMPTENTIAADPPPILSNNPPSAVTTALTLRKEMTGYSNYGNPSGNADILYTGNTGTWTFAIPPFLIAAVNRFRRTELVMRGALDDHYAVPENRYRMTVNVNGTPLNVGPLPFVHGRPAGGQFTNWNQLTMAIPPRAITRNNRIVIRNTSNAGPDDFIAIDWMELRLFLF